MMSDFTGDGGSEMTPKNWTLEGKNWMSGADVRVKNCQISFMDDPLLVYILGTFF